MICACSLPTTPSDLPSHFENAIKRAATSRSPTCISNSNQRVSVSRPLFGATGKSPLLGWPRCDCGSFFYARFFCDVTACNAAENLSPLGTSPNWDSLERYQETITHDDFVRLLESVYCPNGASSAVIKVEPLFARITTDKATDAHFTLRFAKSEATRRPLARAWATAQTLPPRKPSGPFGSARCARSRPHRRRMGKNGRALVQGRRRATGAGRRHDIACSANDCAAIAETRRESFARPRQTGADNAKTSGRFRRTREGDFEKRRDHAAARGFHWSG